MMDALRGRSLSEQDIMDLLEACERKTANVSLRPDKVTALCQEVLVWRRQARVNANESRR